ncbi:P-loop containing nucleoside triphosphate hydrolase protein [Bisporella sp. PMI_857]|nr:P-loop containing nucleoside triphosphate hydrolase protein [Bisporella sp. PMI_857]
MAASIPYTRKPTTDIFTNDTSINRRECQRKVPMRVLALGLGRTGTVSLRIALQKLGYTDTYHMMSASVENPPDCLMWQDALAAKYEGKGRFRVEEWDALLGHCQAVCDWPAAAFAKELIEAYPTAKVILTRRDVDSWHASAKKTVHWRAHDPVLQLLSKCDWAAGLYYPMLRRFWDYFFLYDFERNGKDIFRQHYQEVRDLVPLGNLLEYQVDMGWEPLCKFLGHPVPPTPFPRANDAEDFVTRCKKRNLAQLMNVVFH